MIRCRSDYKGFIDIIAKRGDDVNGTYEMVGAKFNMMPMTTEGAKEMFEISDEFEKEFVEAICTFKEKTIGPYITEKYFNLVPGIKTAIKQFHDDCNETRRAVIMFPKEHCFQSIQFLLRDETINVVCFMRSCDAIKNLPYDAWLCHKLADMFAYSLQDSMKVNANKYHKVTMMFGSLHCYKKDLKNVL